MENKRNQRRIPVHILTQIKDHHGIPSTGIIVDMTSEGCGINHKFPPRSNGLIFELSFNVPGRPIKCRARVANTYRDFKFGVTFLDLSEIDQVYIESYLYRRMQAMEYRPAK